MTNPRGKLIPLLLGMCLLVAASACDNDDEDGREITQRVELEAFDFYFQDPDLLLELGARVTVDFVNAGDNTHSFTSPDLDIDVEAASGESTQITFDLPNEPGLVDFFCKYHPDEMNGTISIGGADVPIEEDVDQDRDDEDADVDIDTEN